MNSTAHPIEHEEVMAYLDGELAAERAAAVAAHLDHCAECAALAQGLRGVSTRMAEWQVEAMPEALEIAIREEMNNAAVSGPREQRKFRFVWNKTFLPRWVWGLAFSVAGLFLIAAVMIPNLLRSRVVQERQATLPVDISREMKARIPKGEATRAGGGDKGMLRSSPSARPTVLAIPGVEIERKPDRSVGKTGPMVIRTASVTLETKQFDATRAAIERIVGVYGGHIGQLQTAAPTNAARTLTATLRVPADRLDAALAEIKKLGRVAHESQSSDEVTEQYTDLVARLANSRHAEQRLVEILRTRTGKVEEVLEVEREIASVREEIERMEAQRKSLENRVTLSTVQLELREEFEKKINVAPPSTGTLLWNAMADGLDGAFDSVLALALFLLRAGPSLLLWAALLFLPARSVWRRMRAATAQ